mmetsp:Transcript_43361/g.69422  ORF Transcript_43361/g.69422 Transcript_43361/m.69422 type:complete len:114 (+) Transcript_43361:1999-2340(+)
MERHEENSGDESEVRSDISGSDSLESSGEKCKVNIMEYGRFSVSTGKGTQNKRAFWEYFRSAIERLNKVLEQAEAKNPVKPKRRASLIGIPKSKVQMEVNSGTVSSSSTCVIL